MIKSAIEKILELGEVNQFIIDERQYASKGIFPVMKPTPCTLTVHTLSGIVDYVKGEVDPADMEKVFIHVETPTSVILCGEFNAASFYERPEFIQATFDPPQMHVGNYVDLESFIISIQAYYVQTETTANILKIIGNLKDEAVKQYSDDGISQSVVAKVGIAIAENVLIPNPVTLAPFRTFPEITQPGSLFVFRMQQQGQGQAPKCGLWEADNKLWRITAIKAIAEWLHKKLPKVPIIA